MVNTVTASGGLQKKQAGIYHGTGIRNGHRITRLGLGISKGGTRVPMERLRLKTGISATAHYAFS